MKQYFVTTSIAFLIYIVFAGLLAAYVQVESNKKQQQVIGAGEKIPAGYVIVDSLSKTDTDSSYVPATEKIIIRKISDMPAGVKVEVASQQEIPYGWVVVEGNSTEFRVNYTASPKKKVIQKL
jgi:hypothetical protein